MIKTNFHTHCTFCDGKNTAEEMVLEAIKKDFNILGFSSHSMFPFASDYHLESKKHKDYCTEINRLKELYKDKIQIQLGFEADYVQGMCSPKFCNYKEFSPDFLIGSVHYVTCKKGFFEADGKAEETQEAIKTFFNGNKKLAVQTYFLLEREMLKHGDFSVIGHPDLIKMQNNYFDLFNEQDYWYKREIKALAKEIKKSGVCVEINLGGIARGYMKEPYPSPYLLQLLNSYKVPAMINYDAHKCEHLGFGFTEALQYVKSAGYTELCYVEPGGFKSKKFQFYRI